MKKLLNLTKHISEENLTKLSLLLFFTISILIIISIVLHPYVSDDYHYQNMIVNEYQNFFDYFFSRFYDWSGRFFQNTITYFIYSNYIFELFYKILIFPIFFVTCHLIWFKIANFNKKNNHFPQIWHVASGKPKTVKSFAKYYWKKYNAKGKLFFNPIRKKDEKSFISDQKSIWKIK